MIYSDFSTIELPVKRKVRFMKTKNTDIRNRAFQYYCKGLNSKEIGKLLDISYRTIQNWMSADNWKNKRSPTPVKQKALGLYNDGFSYKSIAKMLNVSRTTVYLWIKDIRSQEKK